MSVNDDQTAVLARFLLANESRLPPSYRTEQALGAAIKRRSTTRPGGEFDTDSADVPHADEMEELHIHEQDILLDREVVALMDTDDAHLQEMLEGLEKEASYLFSSSLFSCQNMHHPETVTFISSNGKSTMSADSFRQSKDAISGKMYDLVQEQNGVEKELIQTLDRGLEALQQDQELTPQQVSEITSDARNSLMYLKMSLEKRREQSIARRIYRSRRAEKVDKYSKMTSDEQARNLAELKQSVARHLSGETPV